MPQSVKEALRGEDSVKDVGFSSASDEDDAQDAADVQLADGKADVILVRQLNDVAASAGRSEREGDGRRVCLAHMQIPFSVFRLGLSVGSERNLLARVDERLLWRRPGQDFAAWLRTGPFLE